MARRNTRFTTDSQKAKADRQTVKDDAILVEETDVKTESACDQGVGSQIQNYSRLEVSTRLQKP